MSPALRRTLLALVCVLLVGGLLLSGAGHAGLHGDHHGTSCDACALVSTAAPAELRVGGPELAETHAVVPAVCAVERVEPRLEHSPRGPPAAA